MPIVVLSQLSRAPESRSDHRPQLSDLRESGALEQDADVVVVHLPRGHVRRQEPAGRPTAQGVAELIIGKQRNGPTGVVEARVHPRVHAVRELALAHRDGGSDERQDPARSIRS